MIDEIFDRSYRAGRAELNAGIDHLLTGLGRELGKSLSAVHRFEWNAPWSGRAKDAGRA